MLVAEASSWPRPYVTVRVEQRAKSKLKSVGVGLQGEELVNLQVNRCPFEL